MDQSFLIVRPATLTDLTSLVELRAHLLDGTSASYSSKTPEESAQWRAAYRSWLSNRLNDSDCVQILAAEHKESGQVLGCATAIIDQRAPAPGCLNGLSGWVQSVVVEPQWRNHGIARQLMQHLLRWFANRGVGSVVLQSTEAAGSLYQALGFTASDEHLMIRQEASA
ncbi:GNAT family N-acetyltransferase [Pseudomonas aeruginosa]|uniref:GNAT family N-acetyltransferase n=1 Tax=Pseudomonas aeruginosa TaxID=287 RepID=UPI00193E7868|nr:GNAT family N-acetyltransferase [Pseudomonas aeruginosa]MBI8227652.1 GNAT family N-acetyltransferase [Pseudomonas aeruginosa]MDP5708041.1 GNAT family N-acetyltransferase [Pseudomonas aeruginosa]HBO0349223.1 GNAT family N-acetyltransferase [Pseudomonas aeruginosa]